MKAQLERFGYPITKPANLGRALWRARARTVARLTRLQFEERLKKAAPGDTITVYSSGWTEHTISSNRFPYLYWRKGAVDMPIHANHVHKLTTAGGSTWERR